MRIIKSKGFITYSWKTNDMFSVFTNNEWWQNHMKKWIPSWVYRFSCHTIVTLCRTGYIQGMFAVIYVSVSPVRLIFLQSFMIIDLKLSKSEANRTHIQYNMMSRPDHGKKKHVKVKIWNVLAGRTYNTSRRSKYVKKEWKERTRQKNEIERHLKWKSSQNESLMGQQQEEKKKILMWKILEL